MITVFAISACAWLLYGMYNIFQVQFFIVKRYEKETDLLTMVFFKDHATFTRFVPGFLSSSIYSAHILMCLYGWPLFGNKKAFRDITDPNTVIRHFSKKEITRIKLHSLSLVVVLFHFTVLGVFRIIWPEL